MKFCCALIGSTGGAASLLALLFTAGSAEAQATFSFTNECGTGIWSTSCNAGGGLFRNNWGRSAAVSGALVFPGPLDTANVLAGASLTLTGGISVATLNVSVGAAFNWNSGNIITPSVGSGVGLLNGGAVTVTGSGRDFTGTLVNAVGASFTSSGAGPLIRLAGSSSWTNSGTMTFANGAGTHRVDPSGVHSLANNGVLAFTNPARNAAVSLMHGLNSFSNDSGGVVTAATLATGTLDCNAVASAPDAVWATDAGGNLNVGRVASGVYVGDHAGAAQVSFAPVLSGDVVFALQPSSRNPWQWAGGINTGGFLLSNASRVHLVAGSFSGRLLNVDGATLRMVSVNCRIDHDCTWTNDGTMIFAGVGTTDSGLAGTRLFINNGTISFTGPVRPGGLLALDGWTSIRSTPSSRIVLSAEGLATISPAVPWSHDAGRIEGLGCLTVPGTFTISGTRGENPPATLVRGVIAPGMGDGSAPGDIGVLTIRTSRLVMTSDSELEVTLRNPSGSTEPEGQIADRLTVLDDGLGAGQHTLGGVLRVRLAPGTTDVHAGIDHVIVDLAGGALAGTFSQVIDANPIPGVRYTVRCEPTRAIMRVVRGCSPADVVGENQQTLPDGHLTSDDICAFLHWYFEGDPHADYAGPNQSIGGDGNLTADDIIVFLSFYFQGCGL